MHIFKCINRVSFQTMPKWTSTYVQRPNQFNDLEVTLIPGKGVGKELANHIQDIFETLHVPITFNRIEKLNMNDSDHIKKLKKNRIILATSAIAGGDNLEQHQIYQELNTYVDVVTAFSIPGIAQRHNNVDIVIIRENSEGEYCGLEHEVFPGVIESLKIITETASERIAKYAFEFAVAQNRKKVTAVHKANIMKLCDGLFLSQARKVAKNYPQIKFEEMIVDNTTMQLVKTPQQFDVMVMPNLYGSIVSGICAGITGGVGLTPGANVGDDFIMFEPALRTQSSQIAGQNKANPTAVILTAIQMLRQCNLPRYADLLSYGLNKTLIDSQMYTEDIYQGKASTSEFVNELVFHAKQYQDTY